MTRIYMDNNATTPLHPEVLEAMMPHLRRNCGNPSSLHQEGQQARGALESARETIADLLDADPEGVIFTSGGTESNNLAVLGLPGPDPGHVVTSSIEHPSVLGCIEKLQRAGHRIVHLPVDPDGTVKAESLRDALCPNCSLVSVMLANNETGSVQPVAELAADARARGVAFHTDAAQAVGKIPVSFRKLGVTALSLSAHKFNGPVGVGALVVQRSGAIQPLLVGGHQENALRPGTEPVALVVGIAKALELAVSSLKAEAARLEELRDLFETSLCSNLDGVHINAPLCRLPNTSNIRFSGLDAQAAVMSFDLLGVACSTGSACASGAPEPSHVLLAMGLTEEQARSSIRFSFGRLTTRGDVEQAVHIIRHTLSNRRRRTPVKALAPAG